MGPAVGVCIEFGDYYVIEAIVWIFLTTGCAVVVVKMEMIIKFGKLIISMEMFLFYH